MVELRDERTLILLETLPTRDDMMYLGQTLVDVHTQGHQASWATTSVRKNLCRLSTGPNVEEGWRIPDSPIQKILGVTHKITKECILIN